MSYLENTIFTDYAITKINKNLIQEYEDFNFTKIKISSEEGALDSSRTSLTNSIYTLPIDSVDVNDSTFTLYCSIPPNIEGLNIHEIGVFDTVNEVDNLFTLSVVSTAKPANLPYELIIILDINLIEANIYPTYPELVLPAEEARTTKTKVTNSDYTLTYVTTNLSRLTRKNADNVGYNTAQVFYKKQQDIDYWMRNFTSCSFYSKLLSYIGENLVSDCYFNNLTRDNIFYKIVNLKNPDQDISVNNLVLKSSSDNINFDAILGNSLLLQVNLGDLLEGVILSKGSDSDERTFFSFKVADGYLVFTLNSEGGEYSVHYSLQSEEVIIRSNSYNTFIITFNNNFNNPKIELFINGQKVTVTEIIENFTSLTSYKTFPLINYSYTSSGITNLNNDFFIKSLINFNKVLTEKEIFYINAIINH